MATRTVEIRRIMRFGLVGCGATLVHLAVAHGLLATGTMAAGLSNITGFIVAFLTGFLGHHHFTFSGAAPFGRALRRFGVIALAGFLLNNVVLFGLVYVDVVTETTALTFAILIVPVGTFLASRLWGFAGA